MKIPACIFTYGGDAMALPWTVRGARLAGFVPVVLEDAAAPLPAHTRGWLQHHRVELRATTFPRRNNLNGTDCAAGICAELAAAADRHDSSHVIKLDTDTVIVDPGLYTPAAGVCAVGLVDESFRPGGAFGMAYMLRADVAAAVAQELADRPLDPTAPEDLTIWQAAEWHGVTIEHEFHPQAGPFTALPLGADADDAVRRFGVVTTAHLPAAQWTDKPRQVAGQIREIVRAAEALRASRGNHA